MPLKVAVVYNQPDSDRYHAMGESKAEQGVLDEVKAVSQALAELKYSAQLVPLSPPLSQVQKNISQLQADVVFNLFEGFDGSPETEAMVAEMLSERGIPFTGCPPAALALALDKAKAKEMMSAAGIPTPGYQILTPENISTFKLDYPCIIKPVAEDASHGLSEDSVVYDFAALQKQLTKISRLFGNKVLVEEYLEGREFNTCVIGKQRLSITGISEIVYTLPPDKPRILTFSSKWEEDSLYYENTKAVCPADITEKQKRQITRIAMAAFRLMGCRGYARVDMRQDSQGNFKVLEVNPNPDISPGAGVSIQAAANGMTYTGFIKKLIGLALN